MPNTRRILKQEVLNDDSILQYSPEEGYSRPTISVLYPRFTNGEVERVEDVICKSSSRTRLEYNNRLIAVFAKTNNSDNDLLLDVYDLKNKKFIDENLIVDTYVTNQLQTPVKQLRR